MVELLHTDCMAYMATLPDKAFDLAIVDPPYGIGCDAVGMSNRASNSPKFKGYRGKQFAGGEWDKEPMPYEYFMELKRVSKHQIIWGANHFIQNIPQANSSSWVVWYKNGQNPQSTNADCELAYTSHKTAVRYFRYDWSGFGAINAGEDKVHPTQKPVALYKWLLKNYAKEGDRILDTHLGSGSSAIAAHDGGFEFVGCEIDADYYAAAVKRFNIHKMQQVLF
jgi:site-specific DNA-methyltransferase (adenine-specific)